MSENESDQEDHEEASFDLFSDNSDGERDDSSSDDEEGATERDFTNVKFPEFCHYDKKYCVYNDPYKNSRTSKYCDRCNSAACSNHAKILCRQCFAS